MKMVLTYVGIIGLLFTSQVFGATRPATKVTCKAGELTGEVFNSVGKRVPDLKLTLTDVVNDKIVTELVTDETGAYTIGNLVSGNYLLQVGDTMSYEMKVFEEFGISKLKIVLPDGYAAGMMEQIPMANWAGGVFGTSTQTGGIIILSTAAATAGGGAAIIANNEGGRSSDTVSPP